VTRSIPAQRIRNRSEENREALQDKDLERAKDAAYRPAYGKIPREPAELVAVWQRMPEPIRRAIRALVESAGAET
jgi:hypothetical protein